MGLPSMGGGMSPRPNGGAPAPQGAPPMASAGGPGPAPSGDIREELMQLHAGLPPEMKGLMDPRNPLTVLMFKRLRDGISEEEGQALLMLFGNADALALSAAKKVWPEIMLLLDLFDDGEANDSIGDGAAAAGPPGPSSAMSGMDSEDEDEGYSPPGGRSRLSTIMG